MENSSGGGLFLSDIAARDIAVPDITVIGGGLAGSEAAWQLAERGFRVRLYEMRPFVQTPAHGTGRLAEVVCSNSFGGEGEESAAGILKAELALGRSLILECARAARVPAGGALAVDRDRFAERVTARVESHPRVELVREEAAGLPEAGLCIAATGPLTSSAMAEALRAKIGKDYLSFFDAVAPIVTRESVDMEKAYAAGRYGRGSDYLNCPLNKEEYLAFYGFLTRAERARPHEFERGMRFGKDSWFEGCMPIEEMASRGTDTLRFGPMKPVGLPDPRTGREPYAAVQLRQDNSEGTLLNLVGFQTGLKWGEQARLIRMIPGLENADIVRFGVMHRNIYVNAPAVLDSHLRLRNGEGRVFLAGQITGVEGYMESTAMGLAAGVNAARLLQGRPLPLWPRETAIGSLLHYLQDSGGDEKGRKNFQPMNMNLGLFPAFPQKIRDKKQKARMFYERAAAASRAFWEAGENPGA
ncbi:MAG: methylenetetrahydrofolate--tRNA-(uracil(54)-C(5))-methyltransferase (FADH(2)-oxidizing) TrmFO [Synergistaceae bacterium]|nr:methylenetetrahydrofolate--tRNA-(uracil(54)-C(5))-methyltransferase (FADH(2)-oxidizing) TrmFO [Synergistaceae bacterium]